MTDLETSAAQYMTALAAQPCGHKPGTPDRCWVCHAREFIEHPHTAVTQLHREQIAIYEAATTQAAALQVRLDETHKQHGEKLRNIVDDHKRQIRERDTELLRLNRAVQTTEPVAAIAEANQTIEELHQKVATLETLLATYRREHPDVAHQKETMWDKWGDTTLIAALAQTTDNLSAGQLDETQDVIDEAIGDGVVSKSPAADGLTYGLPGWVRTRWTQENGA